MPFIRPSLLVIVNRTRDDLFSRLAADDPLRRSDAEAYARVLAGSAHELYGYLDWLARQLMPDTADVDYLERWASIYGLSRKAAASATGIVAFTGLEGAAVLSGQILSALDGILYATTTDAIIASGAASAPVSAVVAGEAGNRAAGQTFMLQSPVAGINASAIASAISGGADVEADDALRDRLLLRIRNPPQGGAQTDYEEWALEVAGITRVWVAPLQLGPGTVVVRFMRDGDTPAIPDSTEVAALQSYLDVKRPVTAQVTALAPIAQPINFTLTGPADVSARATVEAALADIFRYDVAPGATVLVADLEEASEAGGSGFSITSPAADVPATTTGHLPTLGTITWA